MTHNVNVMVLLVVNVCQKPLALVIVNLVVNVLATQNLALDIVLVML